jgi:hypothetical protein
MFLKLLIYPNLEPVSAVADMSPTSCLLLYPAIYVFKTFIYPNLEPVSAVADISPTSCLLLYPAIYVFKTFNLSKS